MLRLPQFEVATPSTVREAIELYTSVEGALIVAGGTDLVPNMKHELFTPPLVVSLANIASLRGIARIDKGWLSIGAMTTLADVATSDLVTAQAPALAQATGLVAGPQLRAMGTLGGNVLLDTRCQWYNQTYFWRQALGFCLKKDGSKCHVVEGGSKCVAAASNDSAPALMTLGAILVFEGPAGRRSVPIDDLWLADGIVNKRLEPGEILVEIQIPPTAPGHRGAYGKLRERGSIDFPLLGVAVALDVDNKSKIERADVVLTALQARPLRIKRAHETLVGHEVGTSECATAIEVTAELAHKQCHPMPNILGDHDWRREMVTVYVRRTLKAAIDRSGPVHHV
ncbi:MAG: FAD binding domain-containing protein [Planctomycetota bacterium]|nr:FAD binding domain-containing protein [Planctomycetota bacterium]